MIALLGAAAVVACSGGEPAAPVTPPVLPPVIPVPADTFRYPAVAGTYEITGTFDDPHGGTVAGSITLVQASRNSRTLTGTAAVSYYNLLGSGTARHTEVQNASVNEAGTITFELPAPLVRQRWFWTFTGSIARGTITGTHALKGLPFSVWPRDPYPGRFTARVCTTLTACGTTPAPPMEWRIHLYGGGYYAEASQTSMFDGEGYITMGCFRSPTQGGPWAEFDTRSLLSSVPGAPVVVRFTGARTVDRVYAGKRYKDAEALDFWTQAAAATSITITHEFHIGTFTGTWDTRALAPVVAQLRAHCALSH